MQVPEVGYVFEDAVVRRVDHTLGLLLEIPIKETTVAAYVHVRYFYGYQHLSVFS